MNYQQLSASYKYDTLAEAIYAREVEHFHYEFDLTNFIQIAGSMEPGPARDNMLQRIEDTKKQMRLVENIYNALIAQIDDQQAYEAAVQRAMLKRQLQA